MPSTTPALVAATAQRRGGDGSLPASASFCPRRGPAVGVDHIAVNDERALAEEMEPGDGAQGAADEALYFGRAPAGAAPLAGDAGEGGTRQHAVFGGDPAGARATGEE